MSERVAIKRVSLGERNTRPGRTRHFWGNDEFPPFASLEIVQHPGDSAFYLLHLCENGQVADTYHETLDDAFHQAEYEFDVKPEEWTDVK
jgi:hypothetical protein